MIESRRHRDRSRPAARSSRIPAGSSRVPFLNGIPEGRFRDLEAPPEGPPLLDLDTRARLTPVRRPARPGFTQKTDFLFGRPMGRIFEDQKAHDVRALEPHGEAVRPHRQGHHHRRQGGRPRSRTRNPAPARASSRTRARSTCRRTRSRRRSSARPARTRRDYQEIIYEGYAPHGVAVLVETATDNPTRTVANVRTHLHQGRRQPRHHRQRRLPVQARWACSA